MEGELSHEIVDVFRDEWCVSAHALTGRAAPRQAFEPAGVCLCLPQNDGMAFLENLMNCNKGFESLHLIGKDWLPTLTVSSQSNGSRTFARAQVVDVLQACTGLPQATHQQTIRFVQVSNKCYLQPRCLKMRQAGC
jgi:hypothetical protein